MKTAFIFIGVAFALFSGISLLLYFFQERMIFFPQPTSSGIDQSYASHAVTFSHGTVDLTGWLFKDWIGPDQPLIVYYGGNAEDIALNFESLDRFATRSFLFMNYRGYGGSKGRPGEQALCEDALFILDAVIKDQGINPAHVILMGRSLGSGVAAYVAARRKVGGIILVTPFDSLTHVAQVHYPIFPVRLMLKHRFDSALIAPTITTPALFLTAENDQVVPARLANRLERLWGGPTTSVTVAGTDHNSIETASVYWETINTFLRSNRSADH